jgi:fatty acid desaturase
VRHETLLIAYAAFAFSWSSLQWVYHVRTPLHPVEGAYNLRLPRPVRWLFLNFNYHLTHHRRPNLRWQELYRTSDARETQPLWYRWLGIFRCPQPLPGPPESIVKSYF